jgi:tRNA-Thr(GGU) m(6)t(6)A37 methyltransferase TsaA
MHRTPKRYTISPLGVVHSRLRSRSAAPRQGYKGAPSAWVEVFPRAAPAMKGISVGHEIILITWLHKADRKTLLVHPHGNEEVPLTGVFSTRSPDRPNPFGLHRVSVLELKGSRIKVKPLEAIDGTPVVDIKSTLRLSDDR